jgi:hypothetical protein
MKTIYVKCTESEFNFLSTTLFPEINQFYPDVKFVKKDIQTNNFIIFESINIKNYSEVDELQEKLKSIINIPCFLDSKKMLDENCVCYNDLYLSFDSKQVWKYFKKT